MLNDFNITEYRKKIWKLEEIFTKNHARGLTLNVGGANSPFGDISCDPLLPRDVKCVGESLPFKDLSFGTALLYSILDHCLDPIEVLKECGRVAKIVLIMQTLVPLHIEIIMRMRCLFKGKIPTLTNIDPNHMRHYTHHKLIKHVNVSGLRIMNYIIIEDNGDFIAFVYAMSR